MGAATGVRTDVRTGVAAPRVFETVRVVGRWWLRNWLLFAEVAGPQWR